MLILGRKSGEGVVAEIPGVGTIRVSVYSVRGAAVRLAIEAPPSVLVLRDELVGDEGARAELGSRRASSSTAP